MVIPVHDINPARRTAWVTYGLIAANVIVFLMTPVLSKSFGGATTLMDTCRLRAFFEHWGAVPRELIQGRLPRLAPTGALGADAEGNIGCLLTPPTYHKSPPLSVLTAMFVHGSWLHLLGNMLFLWVFGNNVEDRMGSTRYLLFYLAAGYVAGYGFALAAPSSTQPLIGASGAIAGVLGAYIVLWPKARVWSLVPFLFFIPLRLPAWLVLGLWFVLQAVYSSGHGVGEASVAYFAHVIGFVVGALFALPLRPGTPPAPVRYRGRWVQPGPRH